MHYGTIRAGISGQVSLVSQVRCTVKLTSAQYETYVNRLADGENAVTRKAWLGKRYRAL